MDSDSILRDCDIHSDNSTTLDVPTGALATGFNAIYSANCRVDPTLRGVRVIYSTTGLPAGVTSGYYFQP